MPVLCGVILDLGGGSILSYDLLYMILYSPSPRRTTLSTLRFIKYSDELAPRCPTIHLRVNIRIPAPIHPNTLSTAKYPCQSLS